ncbi:MAG: HD domain-containing protein [Candidatus Colwellbacteria bacterium]|nr:HD domain-containing protein [Candidatus Colwellbacteria bacterium]
MKFNIPKEVSVIAEKLAKNNFSAYLVGGCLRDLLINRTPSDWDIATDARPEEIQKVFSDSVYENKFGTVGIKTDSDDEILKVVEVTTFRKESSYSDARHPDKVEFAKTIEEDLSRRDFTINAIAFNLSNELNGVMTHHNTVKGLILVDPYNGLKDLKDKIIRAVGNAEERFSEDALRLMRAVRFATQFSFSIESQTQFAINNNSDLLEKIAKERIRDEFAKLIMAENARAGVELLEVSGLLKHIIPELRDGIGVGQNKHHIYTVFEHNVKSLEYSAKKGYSLEVRIASLLHDVGKPKSKRGEGPDCTFYGHQVVGERMAKKILERLKFSREIVDKVSLLVREHMFVYDPEVVTPAGVRRLIKRVGEENVGDLIKVREADRIGSGVPKAQPYRLRALQAMIEKVKSDPISPKMLKINGNDLIKEIKIEAGPRLGQIITILLEEVLAEPKENTKTKLLEKAAELNKLSDKELNKLSAGAKKSAEEAQNRIDEEIKTKYFIK